MWLSCAQRLVLEVGVPLLWGNQAYSAATAGYCSWLAATAQMIDIYLQFVNVVKDRFGQI